ncbi:hypothetical protein ACMD2_09163 [Ananas comosus]|uniref:Rubredoxin-like domain-containing protein n=1 Tax=Ananas comosus TaxID=4615 RepID=A0A199V1S7_ANACO|nr:hypothetical protein ACMD2_09163 [Ananas comosus]
MAAAAAASTLSSAAAASSSSFSKLRSPPSPPPPPPRTAFRGVSLAERKWVLSSVQGLKRRGSCNGSAAAVGTRSRGGLEISARTAGASKSIEVEVDKPLGLTLGQKPGGGVVITAVDAGGNAAKAGLKAGDQVLYTSSFFGDELWPADKLGFTKTAIQAKPDSVYFVVSRQARATHICLDCGYIYTLQKPFDEQPDAYVCPQCNAPKKRFARYDLKSGKPVGSGLPPIGVIVGLVVGVAGVGALLVYGLQ